MREALFDQLRKGSIAVEIDETIRLLFVFRIGRSHFLRIWYFHEDLLQNGLVQIWLLTELPDMRLVRPYGGILIMRYGHIGCMER